MQMLPNMYHTNFMSSSDLHNNVSLYGLPLSNNFQPQLSSSSSSMDMNLS